MIKRLREAGGGGEAADMINVKTIRYQFGLIWFSAMSTAAEMCTLQVEMHLNGVSDNATPIIPSTYRMN